MRQPVTIDRPWRTTECPTITSSPTRRTSALCNTQLSSMCERFPIRIEHTSPRITVPGQMLESSPISTSPTTYAVSLTHADSAMSGTLSLNGLSVIASDSPVDEAGSRYRARDFQIDQSILIDAEFSKDLICVLSELGAASGRCWSLIELNGRGQDLVYVSVSVGDARDHAVGAKLRI